MFDFATVCLAPFEIYEVTHDTIPGGLALEGLILEPTGRVKGEYTRRGYFRVYDDWDKMNVEMFSKIFPVSL